MYNEKVMEIFKNPHNVGELKDANAVGQVGNVACGDIMKIFLKINEDEIIEDASFKTFGCAAAIVSSSIATDLIKGMTIKEALEFDNDKIIEIAGELPVHKIHCSVLAKEAIEDAIKNYYKRKAKEEKKAKESKVEDKKSANAKNLKAEKTEVKEAEVTKPAKTETKAERAENKVEAKSLLSSLKLAKKNKAEDVAKKEEETKKQKAVKEKSAKKMEKNFKNLNERLSKLSK